MKRHPLKTKEWHINKRKWLLIIQRSPG
jgi:hypothetical protein